MSLEYIRSYYKVPAEIGRRVRIEGKKEGVIVEAISAYIGVVLDGDKPTRIKPYHPTSEIEYLGIGSLPRPTKAQERYKTYLRSECSETFAEWLKLGLYKHY